MIFRKLVLIANNGTKDNFLPAVTLDIKHWKQYFSSAEGGAWESNEITEFYNDCDKTTLKDYIQQFDKVNVWAIVFCGHGYAKQTANGTIETILELSPGNECKVSSIKNWLQNKQSIIIADSCRKVYPVVSTLVNITDMLPIQRMLSESSEKTYRKACRQIFLKNAYRNGRTYCVEGYAASLGECAHDDDRKGGYYSTSLMLEGLNCISKLKGNRKNILSSNKEIVGSFSSVHDQVIERVNSLSVTTYNEPQHPTREKGNYWPFYVIPQMF